MNRKWVVVLVIISFITLNFASVSEASPSVRTSIFMDYSMKDFHYESVYDLYLKEVLEHQLSKEGNILIEPTRVVTRAEAAFMLYQLLGMVPEEGLSFTDVNSDAWYVDAISAITNKQIMIGYPDGTFKPDQPLTRVHMAKIISKAFEYKTPSVITNTFTDVHKDYAYYVESLYLNKVTTGVSPARYAPQMPIPRNQMATMLNRAYGKIPTSSYNDFQVMNTVNEMTRKVRILTIQGIEKDATSLEMRNELSSITKEPYTTIALNSFNEGCKGCDGFNLLMDFDFGLDFSVGLLTDTKIIVHSVVPDMYYTEGYRGTIELEKINGKWFLKNLTKTSFETKPLNMTIEQALDYIPFRLATNYQMDVDKIEFIGNKPNSDLKLFKINGETIIEFDLNTAYLFL